MAEDYDRSLSPARRRAALQTKAPVISFSKAPLTPSYINETELEKRRQLGPGAYSVSADWAQTGEGPSIRGKPMYDVDPSKAPGPGAYNVERAHDALTATQRSVSLRGKFTETPQEKAAREIPGPGAYNLPEDEILYTPTLRGKALRDDETIVPGPGAYEIPRDTLVVPNAPSIKGKLERKDETIAPGPGAYALPKDTLTSSAPSIRGKVERVDETIVPGPGAYEVPKDTLVTNAPSIRGKVERRDETIAPGPGAYAIPRDTLVVPNAPSIRGKIERRDETVAPGPGAYAVPKDTLVKSTAPSIRGKVERRDETISPGPGAYTVPRDTLVVSNAPSIRGKVERRDETIAPAPGQYEVRDDAVRPAVPTVNLSHLGKWKEQPAASIPPPGAYNTQRPGDIGYYLPPTPRKASPRKLRTTSDSIPPSPVSRTTPRSRGGVSSALSTGIPLAAAAARAPSNPPTPSSAASRPLKQATDEPVASDEKVLQVDQVDYRNESNPEEHAVPENDEPSPSTPYSPPVEVNAAIAADSSAEDAETNIINVNAEAPDESSPIQDETEETMHTQETEGMKENESSGDSGDSDVKGRPADEDASASLSVPDEF